MANWNTLQSSFANGEISPRYVANGSTEFVKNAALEILNGICLPQTNVTKRMGTEFYLDLEATGTENTNVRIWPFISNTNTPALALFKSESVTVIDISSLDSQVYESTFSLANQGYVQKLVNPEFDLGLYGWPNTGNFKAGNIEYSINDILNSYVQMKLRMTTRRELPTRDIRIEQKINFPETVTTLVYTVTGYKLIPKDITGAGNLRLRLKIGYTRGGAELIDLPIELPEAQFTVSQTVNLGGGGAAGDVWLSIEPELYDLTPNAILRAEEYVLSVGQVYLYSLASGGIPPVDLTTPYAGNELERLHFIQSPFDDKELLILHPDHPVQKLYFDTVGGVWAIEDYDFTDPPTSWGANNYPSLATAYQGRLVLTGARNEPETVWTSASGDWKVFTAPTADPVASDPITFTPTDRGVNTFIRGQRRLMFGNQYGEYSVDSQSGLLQPSDIGVYQETSYAVSQIPQVTTIGNATVLHTAGNTAIRMQAYSNDTRGWQAPDVSLKAEHLGRRIFRRLFYTRDPHEILWCIMLDGSIAAMSFDVQDNYQAWSSMSTDGRFIDGCTITDADGKNVIFVIVERVVNGVTRRYVEIIKNLRDIANWSYLDSSSRVFMGGNAGFVGGLGYLEGKSVHYFIDDQYEGTANVINGGFTIDIPANFVDVGLAFNMRVSTFPQGPLDPSLNLQAKKRFSKVGIRGVFTRPPIIQGQRPPERTAAQPMNTTQNPQIILDSTVIDAGSDELAIVTVEEPLPLRLTIAAIVGKLTSNDL